MTQSFNTATAISYIGYDLSDRNIVVEPSPVGDLVREWGKQGVKSAFGKEGRVEELHNASADFHAVASEASADRQLLSVYTPSSELIPIIPTLYKLVGDRSPAVVHTAIVNDKADASDVLAVRQSGVALIASHSVQEAHDISLVAHLAAIRSQIPFIHFYDASTANRRHEQIHTIQHDHLGKIINAQHNHIQTYRNVDSHDTKPSNGLFLRPSPLSQIDYTKVIDAALDVIAELKAAFGDRRYDLFEYTGSPQATSAVVVLGTASDAVEQAVHDLVSSGEKVGVLRVRLYRPWSEKHFLAHLPKTVEKVAVLEPVEHLATGWGPLFLDVAAAFHSGHWQGKAPLIRECRVQIGHSGFTDEIVRSAFHHLTGEEQGPYTVRDSKPYTNGVHINGVNGHHKEVDVEQELEGPYIKVINQLFGQRAAIANLVGKEALLEDGIKNAAEASVEFGLGKHFAGIQQREAFAAEVTELVGGGGKVPLSSQLRDELSAWLQHRQDAEKSAKHAAALEKLLGPEQHPALAHLYQHRSNLHKPSRWLIGGDKLTFDIGNSGVHHVISSNEKVNMLVLDTQPYSEKVNPSKTDKRKKDIGLYAMQYGGVYVASIAVNSSYAQALRAFAEAEAFLGPSVVIAYAPRIEKTARGVSVPLAALKETKLAVDSGYWPLYRWNPSLEEKNEEPFSLDSDRVKKEIHDFLERENHLAYVARTKPDIASQYTYSAEIESKNAVEGKVKNSYSQLLASLNKQPILILYGSDGGNAEGVAKRLNAEAKQRNLRPRLAVMDSFPVEDLTKETNVVFVVSTAGQGEFPGNSKETWKALCAAVPSEDFSLANTRYSVLALGDSHYWPLPEDAHYFAKSGKDLDAKLASLGAPRLCGLGICDDQDPDGKETGFAKWRPELWQALGVDELEVKVEAVAPSDNAMKESSNYLRGTIAEGLLDTSTGALSELDGKLMKFHGSYMQDDRDIRDERLKQGLEPAFSFMIRCRIPGGLLTPAQWLAMDELADRRANGTLKITTRQTFQFHGIIKSNLKLAMQDINRSLMDTIAACGDVNRNVMCSVNPGDPKIHAEIQHLAERWSKHLLPRTGAYHEIWLDKKLVRTTEEEEPFYGKTYLPRKFKTVIAVPPYNDVDIFAHDLGYIAILEHGKIVGYNVTVGGGMGMTHGLKKTFPRLADQLGFCTPEQAIEVGEQVAAVQRDYGDRTNRRHARLKYTIEDHGIEWFREEVQRRLGYQLGAPRPFKFISNGDRYGWVKGTDGSWSYTMFIDNGRVKDTPEVRFKTGLREVAKVLKGTFRMTGNQHLMLCGITEHQRPHIAALMRQYNIDNNNHSAMRLHSMACVALPTCGLAMAESERYLPTLITKIDDILEENGLRDDAITIRMTGCPNGCARPQLAEIGFVGKAPGAYNFYLGGGHSGERLNRLYKESVGEEEILELLRPIIKQYALERHHGETFGDFVIRAGIVQATLAGRDYQK
ncbi:hypothetical protein HK097_000339 [Rhizophlyctis rosea]|uniref:assimilatory sulfite reductase (NADPH) n=1 Tax=Rhizophlyctis rosea TaxID=64517 RepID=A0AAD5SGI5_9FUNG|nr:hypothetical protein HK097_000339 [Rhizophlyctis rosea]